MPFLPSRLSSRPQSPIIGALALLGLAVLVYYPCLHGPPLWDDWDWMVDIEWNLKDKTGLWRIWTQPGSIQQYYPVTGTSFWLDYQLWGRDATLPRHLENVLLHGAGAVLFWLLLARLRVPGAWLAAALYAVHPVMAESVAWITERKNVLCSFFCLAALLAHGSSAGWWESRCQRRGMLTLLACLLFLLALLSKISAAVLPAVVMVTGCWRHGRMRWREDGGRMLPWLVLTLPLIFVTHHLEQKQVTAGDLTPVLSWIEKLMLASQLPWFYLGKLVWPRDLVVIYEKWPLQPAAWWHWAGAAALLLGFVLVLWKRQRGVLALSLIFLGTLFPVLGFFEVNGMKYAWAADRWVHLPALAVFAGAGVLLSRLPRQWLRLTLAPALLITLAVLCWRQSMLYSDMDRFWQAAIAGNASPWKARNDYGGQLSAAERHAEALAQLEKAIRLKPDYAAAHVNLAGALDNLGRPAEALAQIDHALRLQPETNAAIHYNRAVILDRLVRPQEAEAELRIAIEAEPDFFAAHNDLGNKLLLGGRLDEAMRQFETLQQLRPGNAKALTSIGNIHFLRGDTGQALAFFDAALRADPAMVSALANSAWILATTPADDLRASPKALQRARQAVETTGRQDPGMLQILAAALADGGQFDEACSVAREAAALAQAQGKQALAQNLEAMATLFAQKQPYRLPKR